MKKGYIKILLISMVIILSFIINLVFDIFNMYTYILFLVVIFISSIYFIGYEKDNILFKKDIITTVVIACIFYLVVTYFLGLFIGFTANAYKLTLMNILKNVITVVPLIIIQELIRYNLVKKGSRNIYILALIVVVSTLMDITLIIKGFNLSIAYDLTNFVFTYLLTSFAKNIYLTFLVYKGGYKPSIVYRSIMELPIYFVPIYPGLGLYMDSIVKILFPTIMIFIIYKLTAFNEKQGAVSKHKFNRLGVIIIIAIIIGMIMINSGWFKYYSLTVGSGSMEPNIKVGDVIIVEKLDKKEIKKLEIGDVLVFKYIDKVVIHRIVDIMIVEGEYIFITKGDANERRDNYSTKESDVIGTAKMRIPFVGYPVVWLNEKINE